MRLPAIPRPCTGGANVPANAGSSGRRSPPPALLALGLALLSSLAHGPAAAAAAPSPLADAVERLDRHAVRTLLDSRAEVNLAQPDGTTALHWAAHHDDPALVEALLAAGARASATNLFAVTPLTLACESGSQAIVHALLEAGADPNTTLPGGETVLMTAARTGRVGPVEALLDRGARPNATDRKGQTALMWAAADGHAAVVERLIRAGADFHTPLKSGFTPLLFAAREGRLGVVRALLRAGADPNEAIRTERGGGRAPAPGTSALLLAVENGHFELALELVRAGADPNDQRSGFTPLHAVSWVRKPNLGDDESGQPPPEGSGNLPSLEFVRRLVAAGADVNTPLRKGDGGRGRLSLRGATPFLLAARTADVPLMQLLVELGADPHRPNADGATPLLAAAGLGCLAPTEEAGTEAECVDAVNFLLRQGAGLDTVDRNGETAMHGAAYKNLPQVVRLLADRGARAEVWNRTNRWGWTPLRIAEGYRVGNFKPSPETVAALHAALQAAGVAAAVVPPAADSPPVGEYAADSKTGFSFESHENSLALAHAGRPVADYIYRDDRVLRPCFANVQAPGGIRVTRNHPPIDGRDATDHDTMHPGIWLAFGDINGADFWRNKGRIDHVRFTQPPRAAPERLTFATESRLTAPDGHPVCSLTNRFSLEALPGAFLLVWDASFHSGDSDFTFGDQEEMGLGVRVATALTEKNGGLISSSTGRRGARNTWGQPADWCDYSGLLDGQRVGLTLMADPDNFRRSWWHNRDYGLMVANPFGRAAMKQGAPSAVTVRRGEVFRLRFGVVIHAGAQEMPETRASWYDRFRAAQEASP